MSSINSHATYNYSQPSEYRFSHDSVFLARRVFEFLCDSDIQTFKALDLCSGCGIIGLDFIFHCLNELGQSPLSFDFMEVQSIYETHFFDNINGLKKSENLKNKEALKTEIKFIQKNYNELQSADFLNKYDLILCNPPYFFPNKGTLSPSEFKNRCRFFIDSDFTQLITGITTSLSSRGAAFILLRDLSDHGWNSFKEAQALIPQNMNIELLGDIRGTLFVKIEKNKK